MTFLDGAAVVSAFKDNNFKFDRPGLADEVAAAAAQFGYEDAQELSDEYEAFMFQRPTVVDLVTKDLADAFRAHLRSNVRGKENAGDQPLGFHTRSDWDSLASVITPTKTPGHKSRRKSSTDELQHKTPAPNGTSPSAVPRTPASATAALMAPTPNTSFKNRSQIRKVLSQLNAEISVAARGSEDPALEVKLLGRSLEPGARYMSDTLRDKALFIEGRILKFISALEAAGGPAATYPVSSPAQEAVIIAGRIVCDSDGHLNAQSVLLEGSIRHSGGLHVRLDLSKVPSYSLIPGQIVALEGLNPSGGCFVASRVISEVPLSPPAQSGEQTAPKEVAAHSAVIACGPFSTTENLAYEPLQELLDYCQEHKPTLLVLMGPFVDADHPDVTSGQLDITFEEVFAAQVRDQVEGYLQGGGSSTKVILMPSLRCVQHHPVYPQPPMEAQSFDPPGSVACLPNPCTWSFGDAVYGATSVDVLKHVSSADIRRGNVDRMSQLGGYLLGQRSFYPLYPPPIGVNLDASLASHYLAMPEVPGVIVAPSDLAACAKTLSLPSWAPQGQATPSSVLINPGRLAKGPGGGTFAHLHVRQHQARPGGLAENIRVDILRI